MTTQAQKLTTMPKYYYVKLSPNVIGVRCKNNLAGFEIKQMTITFGTLGRFTFTQWQLWQLFKRNTGKLDISYAQWVALGSPCVIQPSTDIASSGDLFPGKENDAGIMFFNNITYCLDNYARAGITNLSTNCGIQNDQCFAYEAWINNGNVQIGGGTCVFKNTTTNEAKFVQALDQNNLVSEDQLTAAQGAHAGSFFGTMKGLFHGAKKLAGMGARALQSPLAQKGLEYLASQGAGMSAGGLSHSLRRRK